MTEIFVALTGNELQIVLAQQDASVYFTKTHIADLKTVIENDRDQPDESAEDIGQSTVAAARRPGSGYVPSRVVPAAPAAFMPNRVSSR